MTEPVSQKEVDLYLTTEWLGRILYTERELESTNLRAKELINQATPEGTVVYAEVQTKGRGRWGREWYSPEGLGLWFSVILNPAVFEPTPQGVVWLGCFAVQSAVEKLFDVSLKIRWPNDLYFMRKKCCGFLAEYNQSSGRSGSMVLGIGINVNQTMNDFPDHLRAEAISMRMITGRKIDRSFLFAEILNQLEYHFNRVVSEGSDWLYQKWIALSDMLDQSVVLRVRENTITGRVAGFERDGKLIIRNNSGGFQSFGDGEVLEVKDVTGH